MARYYLAPSLVRCRDEVNRFYPRRDKTSDGWVGDLAHSERVSDHNPDPSPNGVVRAIDVDKDGIDPMALVAAAIAHPAVNYVIFDGSIWTRSRGFRRAVYTGTNKHEHHVHISIQHTASAEASVAAWLTKVLAGLTQEDDDMTPAQDAALAKLFALFDTGRGKQALDRILGALNAEPSTALNDADGAYIVKKLDQVLLGQDDLRARLTKLETKP